MIAENVDDRDALGNQFVGTLPGCLIVDAGDHPVDLTTRRKWLDMGWPRNASMQCPVSGVMVDIPAVNFSDEFRNSSQHIATRGNGGLNLKENSATKLLFLIVHIRGSRSSGVFRNGRLTRHAYREVCRFQYSEKRMKSRKSAKPYLNNAVQNE